MKPRLSLITLGVNDLKRLLQFYRNGLGLSAKKIIGALFVQDAGFPTESPSQTAFTLGHNISSKAETDHEIARAAQAGAARYFFFGGATLTCAHMLKAMGVSMAHLSSSAFGGSLGGLPMPSIAA